MPGVDDDDEEGGDTAKNVVELTVIFPFSDAARRVFTRCREFIAHPWTRFSEYAVTC